MKRYLYPFLWSAWAVTALHAQVAAPTPRPVPPPGPWLQMAPDFAQWSVTSKGSGAPVAPKSGDAATATPSASPARGEKSKGELTDFQTVVVKTKPIRYEQTSTVSGRKTTTWYLSDLQISTEGSELPVVKFASSPDANNYGKADFPGFGWISARNFEGVQKVSGRDCLVFRDLFKIDGKVVKSDPQLTMVACIDSDSRMPVALQLGDEVRTYQFGAAPNTPLAPPPEIENLATQWRAANRQASRPVAKP